MKLISLHRPVVSPTPPRGAIGPELHRPVVPLLRTTPPRGVVVHLFGGEWHRPVVCLKVLPHGYGVSRCAGGRAPVPVSPAPEQFGQQRDDSLRAHREPKGVFPRFGKNPLKPLPSPFLLVAAESLLVAVLPACERNATASETVGVTVRQPFAERSSNPFTRDARVTHALRNGPTGGSAQPAARRGSSPLGTRVPRRKRVYLSASIGLCFSPGLRLRLFLSFLLHQAEDCSKLMPKPGEANRIACGIAPTDQGVEQWGKGWRAIRSNEFQRGKQAFFVRPNQHRWHPLREVRRS